ncbi:hypothetical protein COP2_022934 [Malus domestica]
MHEGHYEFTVIPFEITNASTTFQALMNTILTSLLQKSVIVFFDDILDSIAYLAHIILVTRVTVDISKIEAIVDWSTPLNIRALRGFLGLVGYYRKFIRHFGIIANPLIDLLRKDGFLQSTEADMAFAAIKEALSTTPVLTLPNFTISFTIECDALNVGIGAVLSQDNYPIEFLSKPLAPKTTIVICI